MANRSLLPEQVWSLSKLLHQEVAPAVGMAMSLYRFPSQHQMTGILATKRVERLNVNSFRDEDGASASVQQLLQMVRQSPRWHTCLNSLTLRGPCSLSSALPLPHGLRTLDFAIASAADYTACTMATPTILPPGLRDLHVDCSWGEATAAYPHWRLPEGLRDLYIVGMRFKERPLELPASLRNLELTDIAWDGSLRLVQAAPASANSNGRSATTGGDTAPMESADQEPQHQRLRFRLGGYYFGDSASLSPMPPAITELAFSGEFNLPLSGVLPARLVRLDLSEAHEFNQPLHSLPSTVEVSLQSQRRTRHAS
jgi:hypothetical protein